MKDFFSRVKSCRKRDNVGKPNSSFFLVKILILHILFFILNFGALCQANDASQPSLDLIDLVSRAKTDNRFDIRGSLREEGNKSFRFDGASYVLLKDLSSLVQPPLTIQFTFRPADYSSVNPDAVILKSQNGEVQLTRDERDGSHNNISIYIKKTVATLQFVDNSDNSAFVVIKKQFWGWKISVWVNGRLADSYVNSNPLGGWYVGGDGVQNFHGLIKDIKIYNRQLSSTEIDNITLGILGYKIYTYREIKPIEFIIEFLESLLSMFR
jgi:hypothetical protein